ncbi:MAG: hypothetical protein WDA71_10590 [Actinomycetota bacterium]
MQENQPLRGRGSGRCGWMRLLIVAAVAGASIPAGQVAASAKLSESPPQGPAKARFATGFPLLIDHEWKFRIGGFGGLRLGAPLHHVPVIFVHGNNVDHADWYPVRDEFKKAGWTDQEMFALSYDGLGSNNGGALFTTNPERDSEHKEMGKDGTTPITANDINVPDLYDFILAVRAYTGSHRFSIVSHSLGVTLARKTLKVHRELRKDLVAFVGIAGGNHGTSLCPPGSEGDVESCDEIAQGTKWLADLNGPDGSDETYAPAKWMTVFDGSGAGDPAYAGPTYAKSPSLKGADNREFPHTYHNDLRMDPAIIPVYRGFVESAEKPYLADLPKSRTAGPVPSAKGERLGAALPATGPGGVLPIGTALLLAAAGLKVRRPSGSVGRG